MRKTFLCQLSMLYHLGAIGFGASRIVDGSIAAGVQSSKGNVVVNSWFAKLQSLGNLTAKQNCVFIL